MKLSKNIYRVLLGSLLAWPLVGQAQQGQLENPMADTVASGIGIVSGWHCTAKEITVSVDGKSLGRSGVGSVRNDTREVCSDVDNGFSLLFNYNDLKPGKHILKAYADGQLLAERTFYTVRSAGQPYVSGLKRDITVENFPVPGRQGQLSWRDEKQNFVVTQTQSIKQPPLDGVYRLIRGTGMEGRTSGSSFTGELILTIRNGVMRERGFIFSEKDDFREDLDQSYAIEDHGNYFTLKNSKLKGSSVDFKRIIHERGDRLTLSYSHCIKNQGCYTFVMFYKRVGN